jgi:hypothetical protein
MMNKRIKELAEQAELSANRGDHVDVKAMMEKFAELIVRECVSLFDGSEEMKTVGFLSHKEIVDKIEEHFRS